MALSVVCEMGSDCKDPNHDGNGAVQTESTARFWERIVDFRQHEIFTIWNGKYVCGHCSDYYHKAVADDDDCSD